MVDWLKLCWEHRPCYFRNPSSSGPSGVIGLMGEENCSLAGGNVSVNQSKEAMWAILVKEEEHETVYKLPTFILLSVLITVGLPGNVLTLLVYGFRFPASTTKSFIMAMAVFDIINCLVGIPFEMIDLRFDMVLDVAVICKVIRFWVTLSACGSVTVLIAVSIDRFRRICQPFRKQMTVKQSRQAILALTLLSAAMSAPAAVLYGQHTVVRYGIKLYDCSIDDMYKGGPFAAAYQYFLAVIWTVSIPVLIIMYSFIIYNIHLQKQRRDKLSGQSHGSAVLTRLQMLENGDVSSEGPKNVSGTSTESTFLGGSYLESPRRKGSKCSGDVTLVAGVTDNKAFREPKNCKLPMRLFSRDVNPVFEEAQNSDKTDAVKICDADELDSISLPDVSYKAEFTSSAKTSLNNYLASSRDTGFTTQSSSTLITDKARESGLSNYRDISQPRTRKYGHSFSRCHPWECEKLLRQVSVMSSVSERERRSPSAPVLEHAEGFPYYSFKIRRASSLPSLQCSRRLHMSHQINSYSCQQRNQNSCNIRDSKPDGRSFLELKSIRSDKDTTRGVPHSKASVQRPSQNSIHLNVTCESSDLQSSHNAGLNKEKANTETIFTDTMKSTKSRSVSIKLFNIDKSGNSDTFQQLKKKKRPSVREVKTSKVSLMMLMVTAGFILSYLPHLCIQLLKNLTQTWVARLLCSSPAYFVIHHFLLRSFFINNAINPIIYSFYNKTFRARCKRLLLSPKSLLQTSDHRTGLSVSQDNDTS